MSSSIWTAGRVPLSELVQLDRNPKAHNLDAIIDSFFAFGYVEPVIINGPTRHLVHGHGRDDGLTFCKNNPYILHDRFWDEKRQAIVPPPGVIMLDDGAWTFHGIEIAANGDWLVPVYFVKVPEDREEALTIALNRTSEVGGWHEDLLALALADLSAEGEAALAGIGYTSEHVQLLVQSLHFPPLEEITQEAAGNPLFGDYIRVYVNQKDYLEAAIQGIKDLLEEFPEWEAHVVAG